MMFGIEAREHLEQVIIPFWRALRDDVYGGYYGYMNHHLEVEQEANKGCILNSRILWFFSSAYMTLKDQKLLDEATHAFEFMKKHCMDSKYGGVYWMVDYKGDLVEDMKHTYNQAFAIYALSSYYEASDKKEAFSLAMELFDKIENTCKDEYGYLEAFDREWKLINNDKLSDNKHMIADGKIAQKTMNTTLHVLEAYTELYRVGKNPRVGQCLKALLEIILSKVYNQSKKRLEVFFDTSFHTIADMHSYGHDIEAAWLLDRAACILDDSEMIKQVKECTVSIAYKIEEVAFEKGALNNEQFNDDIDKTRIWWVQAEGVVGFINAYEQTQDDRFLEVAKTIWQYIKTYIVDHRRNSEWYWQVDENGKPHTDYPIVEPWKCPYHNGRMCLEVIRRETHV